MRNKRTRNQRRLSASFLTLALALLFTLGALVAALAFPGGVRAQDDGLLVYGDSATGTLTAGEPLAIFRFAGTAGDLVTVDVAPLAADLALRASLLSPDQDTVATSAAGAFPAGSGSARLEMFLPQDGTYSILVGSPAGGAGDFTLRLMGRAPLDRAALAFDLLQSVTVDAVPQYFSFTAGACPTTLVAATRAAGSPVTLPFVAQVRAPSGDLVAVLRGGSALEGRVTVAADSGEYEVALFAADADTTGIVTLLVACAGSVPGDCPPCRDAPAAAAPGADDADAGDTDDTALPPPVCDAFRLASPREGVPHGPVMVYWEPAPGAVRYRVTVYNAAGEAVLVREADAPATSALIDMHTDTVGTGFTFTIEVAAIDRLGRTCIDSATQGREAPLPPPADS